MDGFTDVRGRAVLNFVVLCAAFGHVVVLERSRRIRPFDVERARCGRVTHASRVTASVSLRGRRVRM